MLLMTVGSDMLFFRVAGSNNDINVLNQSPLFIDVIRGHTSEVSFNVKGREHHMRYYLTDGIYPSWLVFMKGVPVSQQEKHRFFSSKQSTLTKDVECAFGLLKKMLNILFIYDWSYSQHTLRLIIRAYIILHNMIIDDEWDICYNENCHIVTFIITPPVNYEASISLVSIFQRETHLTFRLIFLKLQSDLLSMRETCSTRLMYLFI
jgi:hypothetical protein